MSTFENKIDKTMNVLRKLDEPNLDLIYMVAGGYNKLGWNDYKTVIKALPEGSWKKDLNGSRLLQPSTLLNIALFKFLKDATGIDIYS